MNGITFQIDKTRNCDSNSNYLSSNIFTPAGQCNCNVNMIRNKNHCRFYPNAEKCESCQKSTSALREGNDSYQRPMEFASIVKKTKSVTDDTTTLLMTRCQPFVDITSSQTRGLFTISAEAHKQQQQRIDTDVNETAQFQALNSTLFSNTSLPFPPKDCTCGYCIIPRSSPSFSSYTTSTTSVVALPLNGKSFHSETQTQIELKEKQSLLSLWMTSLVAMLLLATKTSQQPRRNSQFRSSSRKNSKGYRTVNKMTSAIYSVIIVCLTLQVDSTSAALRNNAPLSSFTGSGCLDGSTEAFQDSRHPTMAACEGSWSGHVENASHSICADGWQVCGWRDENLLKTITWKEATTVAGCYAMNAAQDGGTCNKPCDARLDQDDMAGVGSDCHHQSYGQGSCISGGRIDAGCCMDTHFDTACQYQPKTMTGALCCKKPEGTVPQILIHPQSLTHVLTGVTFVLSCQALGDPTPQVKWLKDGRRIDKNNSRISEFSSGYLLISSAKPEDSGDYECVVTNIVGKDVAQAKVLVTDHSSGCADGTTEGLSQYENIQACAGKWRGHVKRGKQLCKKGWHVCNPKHEAYLKLLTWSDVTTLDGCYAYNSMSTRNKCRRCHRENLAGIGRNCGKIRRGSSSCLAQGQIQVFEKDKGRGCSYSPDLSGVMCCKRPENVNRNKDTDDNNSGKDRNKECTPRCINGGKCVGENKCECPKGYKGAWCQHPVCYGGCVPNSYCIKPDVCRCYTGYTFNGDKCTLKRKQGSQNCKTPCFNGGICKHGYCKCPLPYYGKMCQHGGNRHVLIIEKSMKDKGEGYENKDKGQGYRNMDKDKGYGNMDKDKGYGNMEKGQGYGNKDKGEGYRNKGSDVTADTKSRSSIDEQWTDHYKNSVSKGMIGRSGEDSQDNDVSNSRDEWKDIYKNSKDYGRISKKDLKDSVNHGRTSKKEKKEKYRKDRMKEKSYQKHKKITGNWESVMKEQTEHTTVTLLNDQAIEAERGNT